MCFGARTAARGVQCSESSAHGEPHEGYDGTRDAHHDRRAVDVRDPGGQIDDPVTGTARSSAAADTDGHLGARSLDLTVIGRTESETGRIRRALDLGEAHPHVERPSRLSSTLLEGRRLESEVCEVGPSAVVEDTRTVSAGLDTEPPDGGHRPTYLPHSLRSQAWSSQYAHTEIDVGPVRALNGGAQPWPLARVCRRQSQQKSERNHRVYDNTP